MEYIQNVTEQMMMSPEMEAKAYMDMRFSGAARKEQRSTFEQTSVEHLWASSLSAGRFQKIRTYRNQSSTRIRKKMLNK